MSRGRPAGRPLRFLVIAPSANCRRPSLSVTNRCCWGPLGSCGLEQCSGQFWGSRGQFWGSRGQFGGRFVFPTHPTFSQVRGHLKIVWGSWGSFYSPAGRNEEKKEWCKNYGGSALKLPQLPQMILETWSELRKRPHRLASKTAPKLPRQASKLPRAGQFLPRAGLCLARCGGRGRSDTERDWHYHQSSDDW